MHPHVDAGTTGGGTAPDPPRYSSGEPYDYPLSAVLTPSLFAGGAAVPDLMACPDIQEDYRASGAYPHEVREVLATHPSIRVLVEETVNATRMQLPTKNQEFRGTCSRTVSRPTFTVRLANLKMATAPGGPTSSTYPLTSGPTFSTRKIC